MSGTLVTVPANQEETIQLQSCGFVFIRDQFYNSYGALWYYHGDTVNVIYEENANILSATNTSAMAYCSFTAGSGISNFKIKNNREDSEIKLVYKVIRL